VPEDPYTTLKFPKVVPVATPLPTPSPSSKAIEAKDGGSSRPSTLPDWDDDEIATQRGKRVSIAGPPLVPSPHRASLTVLHGLNAGQVFTVEQDETVLGRGRESDVRIDDVGISRRHARVVRTEGRGYAIEDLGSTNGIFVNGRTVERAELASGDRVQIGPTILLRFSFITPDEEALARKLYEGSTRDALTQLFNRKYATERLAAEVAYAHRHGTLFSLILFDLDYFKRVNDSYGHQAGDVVLRVVAAQVQKTTRTEDVLARYGGEEFVVLVRGIEPRGVGVLAERIRMGVDRLSIPWESRTLKTSVSVGVASLSECGPKAAAEALLALADERLYQAKARGRNRVC
jgi:two-component system, cell cycle response regulator